MATEKKVKRPFEQMNDNEKYLYYRKRTRFALAGKWASIIAPIGIVFGIKFNEYVNIITTGEVIKLTVGSFLAIAVAGVVIYREIKHSEETKHLAPVVGCGLALLFAWLFQIIIDDLVFILAWEFGGQCVAKGIEMYGDHAREESKAYKELAREKNTLGHKRRKYIIEKRG